MSISIQIISKQKGNCKVVKTIACTTMLHDIERLEREAIQGYVIGYDIYEGNTYEAHTLMPFIESISRKFGLENPIVVADSELLSKENIKALEEKGYNYILGAKIKNETSKIKQQILENYYAEADLINIQKDKTKRIVISYSCNRARRLKRLEKKISSGKLTKSNINNRGYNKFLGMDEKQDELYRIILKSFRMLH